MTVHGPSEFFDVVRERLAEKVSAASFVVCISDFARSQLMSLVDPSEWDEILVVRCGSIPRSSQRRHATEMRPARSAC